MRPLIHIGYVKTGSTWLQRRILLNFKDVFMPIFRENRVIREELIRPSSLYFNSDNMMRHVTEGRKNAEITDSIPIISHERLAGAPVSGGFDAGNIAERLKLLLPDAQILIVIREQRSHLLSIYQEYVNQGGATSIKSFIQQYDRFRIPQFDWNFLCYSFLINKYMDLFGQDRVLVLPYELLRSDPRTFVTEIETFVDRKIPAQVDQGRERKSKDLARLPIDRWINFLFFRTDINPAAPFHWPQARKASGIVKWFSTSRAETARKHRYLKFIEDQMPNCVRESNKTTDHLTSRNLCEYGYLMPGKFTSQQP